MKTARGLAVVVAVVCLASGSASASPPIASGGPTYAAGTVAVANAFDGNPGTYWQGAYSQANPASNTPFDVTTWRLTDTWAVPQTVTTVTVTYAVDARFVARNARIDCGSTSVPVPVQQTSTVAVNQTCDSISLYMEAPGTAYTPAVSEIAVTASAGPPTVDPKTSSSYVSVGDSITAGQYAPFAYTALLPIFREGPTYTNKGISGQSTLQMRDRMADVLATGAETVILMGGTNDCQFGWTTATTLGYVDQMVTQAQGAGRAVVIVGPISRNNHTDAGASFTPCLTSLRTALSGYATQHGLVFVDPWPAFETPVGSGHLDDTLTEDGVHPNGRGAFVLAKAIATALGWGFSS